MQRHPHAKRSDLAPVLGTQGTLPRHGGGHGLRGRGERRLHCITDGLEVDATLGLDGRIE
jgi:hypothetical protein